MNSNGLLKDPQGNSFYIPLQIAYHTGTRVGECCALVWDNIDLENKVIEINRILIKKGNSGILEQPKLLLLSVKLPLVTPWLIF